MRFSLRLIVPLFVPGFISGAPAGKAPAVFKRIKSVEKVLVHHHPGEFAAWPAINPLPYVYSNLQAVGI